MLIFQLIIAELTAQFENVQSNLNAVITITELTSEKKENLPGSVSSVRRS